MQAEYWEFAEEPLDMRLYCCDSVFRGTFFPDTPHTGTVHGLPTTLVTQVRLWLGWIA